MSRTWKMPYSWQRRAVRPDDVRGKARAAAHALAERRQLAGLTTRGTIPKRRLEGRLVMAELDALACSIADVYEWLPAEGKARCIALAGRLADIRRRLV